MRSCSRALASQCRAYSSAPKPSGTQPSSTSVKGFATLGAIAAAAAFWSQAPASKSIECEAPKKEEKKPSKTAEADKKQKLEGLTEDSPMRLRMEAFNKKLQAEITAEIERLDGQGKFQVDQWNRAEGGDGISMVLQDGKVFEKAGVGVSVVYGMLPPAAVAQMRAQHPNLEVPKEPMPFFATGISCVMHPHNPNAPTVHFNYRYFELGATDGGEPVSCDLEACDKHDPRYYKDFKKWCDEYFYIPHRGERRGVGGIFFDDLDDKKPDELFAFVQSCGKSFLNQYVPIMQRRKDMPFTEEDKHWQQVRRGRYVEFNLVYDRGTKFGLLTPGARIESILMTMPLTARWEYMHEVDLKAHGRLMEVLRAPKDWIPLQ
ncbi:Coproporphyrinogen-III oxidase [Mortierella alpina]|uniref:coproporphyrinogen oxidase n=1 Tax=Mortierella alpina TaxID=64518 RepID=A0A9P6M479_MORAP|nr:Coproporphyrinogen-III oxidase [Mortierella alpina]